MLAPAASANQVHLRVFFQLSKGKYFSSFTYGSTNHYGYNEEDRFDKLAMEYRFSIPAGGKVGDVSAEGPSYPELAFPDAWTSTTWHAFGTGQLNGTTTSYDCNGSLGPMHGAPVMKGSQDGSDLRLRIPLYKEDVHTFDVSGSGSNGFSCQNQFGHAFGFIPAVDYRSETSEEMTTAIVKFPLAAIRNLKKGHALPLKSVSEKDAAFNPPHDCTDVTAADTCTEGMNWDGTVELRRTRHSG